MVKQELNYEKGATRGAAAASARATQFARR